MIRPGSYLPNPVQRRVSQYLSGGGTFVLLQGGPREGKRTLVDEIARGLGASVLQFDWTGIDDLRDAMALAGSQIRSSVAGWPDQAGREQVLQLAHGTGVFQWEADFHRSGNGEPTEALASLCSFFYRLNRRLEDGALGQVFVLFRSTVGLTRGKWQEIVHPMLRAELQHCHHLPVVFAERASAYEGLNRAFLFGRAAFAGRMDLVCLEPYPDQVLTAWIVDEFRHHGFELERDAAEYLCAFTNGIIGDLVSLVRQGQWIRAKSRPLGRLDIEPWVSGLVAAREPLFRILLHALTPRQWVVLHGFAELEGTFESHGDDDRQRLAEQIGLPLEAVRRSLNSLRLKQILTATHPRGLYIDDPYLGHYLRHRGNGPWPMTCGVIRRRAHEATASTTYTIDP